MVTELRMHSGTMRKATSSWMFLAAISLATVFSVSLRAQDSAPPDISGNWVLNLGKSTLEKDSQLKAEAIEISAKKSKLVFHFKTDGEKTTETYILDGQSHPSLRMSSGDLMSKAGWQGSTLVVESMLAIKIPNLSLNVQGLKPLVDKWTVSSDGRTLSHLSPDGTETRVYDKQ